VAAGFSFAGGDAAGGAAAAAGLSFSGAAPVFVGSGAALSESELR